MLCSEIDYLLPINLRISLGLFCVHAAFSYVHTSSHGSQYALTSLATCVLTALCIVGQRHHINNNKMSGGLTWCNEEVKYLIDIYADGLINQRFDTQKQRVL